MALDALPPVGTLLSWTNKHVTKEIYFIPGGNTFTYDPKLILRVIGHHYTSKQHFWVVPESWVDAGADAHMMNLGGYSPPQLKAMVVPETYDFDAAVKHCSSDPVYKYNCQCMDITTLGLLPIIKSDVDMENYWE